MTDSVDQEVEQDVVEDEVNEVEDAIRAAFDESITDEDDEDDIKMAMVSAGATFKNVTRLYNKFMIDAGLAISKEDRNKAVEDSLDGVEFATEEDFNSAVESLVDAIQGATERSAAALVRAYAKKNELEVYAKPKGTGAARTSFAGKFYDFLAGNPGATKEEATAYINGDGEHEDTSENVKKHLSHYMGIWTLVNKIHTA